MNLRDNICISSQSMQIEVGYVLGLEAYRRNVVSAFRMWP